MKKVLYRRSQMVNMPWGVDEHIFSDVEISVSIHRPFPFISFQVCMPNVTVSRTNPFKAVTEALHIATRDMIKYECLKETVRARGMWRDL